MHEHQWFYQVMHEHHKIIDSTAFLQIRRNHLSIAVRLSFFLKKLLRFYIVLNLASFADMADKIAFLRATAVPVGTAESAY